MQETNKSMQKAGESMQEIRMINHPWHLAHQYEIYKTPGLKVTWLAQYKRDYSEMPRGDMIGKFGIEYVPFYEPGKYDVALLHLDQQCFEKGVRERGKGSLYYFLNSVITDIPKIVIMHGTPFFPESFPNDIFNDDYAKHGISSQLVKDFQEATKDNYVVVNSKAAFKQWGCNPAKDRAIWHGMDADEWWDLPKEPRVVTMINPGGLDKYYDRELMAQVKMRLEEKHIAYCQITVDATFKNWSEYRKFLGRSLVYWNPTLESPMPRARTEAMFSGCCVITTPWQDADQFIVNGENGILIAERSPDMIAEVIEGLLSDYRKAFEIGKKGRETALQVFSGERYRKEWRDYLEFVINDYKSKK